MDCICSSWHQLTGVRSHQHARRLRHRTGAWADSIARFRLYGMAGRAWSNCRARAFRQQPRTGNRYTRSKGDEARLLLSRLSLLSEVLAIGWPIASTAQQISTQCVRSCSTTSGARVGAFGLAEVDNAITQLQKVVIWPAAAEAPLEAYWRPKHGVAEPVPEVQSLLDARNQCGLVLLPRARRAPGSCVHSCQWEWRNHSTLTALLGPYLMSKCPDGLGVASVDVMFSAPAACRLRAERNWTTG